MTAQIERFIFQSLGGAPDSFTPLTNSDLTPSLAASAIEPDAPPPEPTMTLAEVEQVRKEAYANGFRDASKEAEAKAQSEISKQNHAMISVETLISERLNLLIASEASTLKNKQDELTKISLAIARKVAGAALKQDPLAAIESLVTQCLASLVGESKISISVHPSVHLQLQKRLQPILDASGFEGEAQVLADDSITKEDCKVEWKNGSAARDSAKIWAEIEALIQSAKPVEAGTQKGSKEDDNNTIYLANR